ncbi:MAG TPA: hypothetical protein VFL47_08285 [Flavisolibacter sp.]|nr:hypothetical protein [Flavisolibacter sp.]
MEKILLVLNAQKPDMVSIDFACRIASLTASKLTGLFVENIFRFHTPEVTAGDSYFSATTVGGEASTGVLTDTDHAIRIFLDECHLVNVPASVCVAKAEPIQRVITESRFADLLILDPALHFYNEEEQLPSHFAREVLANAECPVLLTPSKTDTIDEIVFCYDGSASSVFAIKQLTYLFPGLADKKVLLLEVSRSKGKVLDDEHRNMMEWLQAHYTTVRYQQLNGGVKDELFAFFFMKTKMLVVMGAYGRNLLSTFFNRSRADVLLRTVDLPLFITHH